mgnify:CR=1 FL=1
MYRRRRRSCRTLSPCQKLSVPIVSHGGMTPLFLSDTYTAARHIAEFEQMASVLSGYTRTCVISFIDLYEKVRRNFPQVKSVPLAERETLGKAFVEIGKKLRHDDTPLAPRAPRWPAMVPIAAAA